jgi:hypothetical protein
MGRHTKPTDEKNQFTGISLPPKLKFVLDKVSEDKGLNNSSFIRLLLMQNEEIRQKSKELGLF